jgi:hypothetical protein
MKANFFKVFWFIYLIEFIIPITLILFYLYGFYPELLIKIPFIAYYVLVVIFHIYKNCKIKTNIVSKLFIIIIVFAIFVGLYEGNIVDKKYLSHLYYASIPILGISFGQYLANSYDKKFEDYFFKIINISFYITAVILLIYVYFHFITGEIAYWGLGTDLHILIPFLFYQGKYIFVFMSIILLLLSGKRATTINVLLEFLLIYFYKLKQISFSSIPKLVIYIILITSIFIYAESQGAFHRFEATLNFDLSDDTNMMYATGGRWQELLGIFDYHNADPIRWLTGAGFGGRYEWFLPLTNYLEMKHYAHFAPISYIFIFGIPFTIILYSTFTYYIFKCKKHFLNPFVIVFIVGIFSSFFGANLFVDIKIWIYFGIVVNILKNPNLPIAQLKIFRNV